MVYPKWNKIKSVMLVFKALFIAGTMGNAMFSFAFSAAAIFWANPRPPAGKVFFTLLAVFAARTSGCLFNNLADRKYDIKNPRTSNRPLANGTLEAKWAYIAILFFLVVTIICTRIIDIKFIPLLPIPLFICFFYTFTKKFTWLCHIVLGVACASAPVGSWLVFSENWNVFYIFIVGIMVATWTAGYDILYSTQDYDFDRDNNLFSIPLRFEKRGAVYIAACLHIVTAISLFFFGYIMEFGLWYFMGAFVCTVILAIEYILIKKDHYERAQLVFSINQVIGTTILIFTLLESFL